MDGLGLALAGGSAVAAGLSALALTGARLRFRGVAWEARGRKLAAAVRAFGRWEVVQGLSRSGERSRRRSACLTELPVLLDVVTLGLSAGLSFDSSLELYCSRYETELARMFSEAMLSWQIGVRSREGALLRLAEELEVGALRRFASVVGEALAFGTPLAEALERQAQAIREEQRSQVEEEIERVPVKMLVPLGTLIVPAMFLAILGPLLGSSLVVG